MPDRSRLNHSPFPSPHCGNDRHFYGVLIIPSANPPGAAGFRRLESECEGLAFLSRLGPAFRTSAFEPHGPSPSG